MKILFIVVNKYPNGDAGSIRQHEFASILKANGYDVTILSLNQSVNIYPEKYEGITYLAFKGRYYECKKQIREYLSSCENPDILFLNTIPLPAFRYVKRYALKNKITLVHDAVEWHSFDQYSLTDIYGLITGLYRNSMINRFIIDKHFKVISISNYLDSYFKNSGINSLRIPVIMNVNKISYRKQNFDKRLHITYAGSPKGKDYLGNIISAIELLSEDERQKLEFTLLGVNEIQLSEITKRTMEQIRKLGCINALGRVTRNDVLKKLENTDFTILIRSEKARYAKAGFPTKVVESLASATPVILNLTSDLGLYLQDGYDSLTVASEEPEDIVVALRRALALSAEKKKNMCLNARKTAEENFNLINYREKLEKFLFD